MSNQHFVENNMTSIDVIIEKIDIKGQYIQLAEPVHLSGQLNVSELRAQCAINKREDLAQFVLQIGVDEAGRGHFWAVSMWQLRYYLALGQD